MNQQVCDTDRLNAFVQGNLDVHAERDLALHLGECEVCGEALEGKVAEAAVWREATDFLGGGAFNDVELRREGREEHNNIQIEQILAQLAPTDDPDSLGRIGGYEVTGVIGSGGMGVVLKAHDRPLDRIVAVKVLASHLAASGSARQRFAREAKAAAAVLHTNVIAIHGVSSDLSLPFLVMPYVPGSSLQKRIDAEGPLPTVDILRIGSQVAAGLAAAHAQGLVHRDIKPANILLEQGVERVTITDFGLARAVDDASMTRSGIIAGTPQYMSPEQARGEPIDHRSDLFSIGSLLYAMSTGHSPFRAETSFGVLYRITHDSPRSIRELNPGIPEWLEAIVMKLLSKSRDDRVDSAEHVAELLEDCLAHVQHPSTELLPKSAERLQQAGSLQSGGSRKKTIRRLVIALVPILATALAIIYLGLQTGTIRIETNSEIPVPIVIRQGEDIVHELVVSKTGASVKLRAGHYLIEVLGNKTDVTIQGNQVELSRGGEWLATVSENALEPSSANIGIDSFDLSVQTQIASWQRQVETARATLVERENRWKAATKIASSLKTRIELQKMMEAQVDVAADSAISAAERRFSAAKSNIISNNNAIERAQTQLDQINVENKGPSANASGQYVRAIKIASAKTPALKEQLEAALQELEICNGTQAVKKLKMKIETADAETEFAKAESMLTKAKNEVEFSRRDLARAREKLRRLQSDADTMSDANDATFMLPQYRKPGNKKRRPAVEQLRIESDLMTSRTSAAQTMATTKLPSIPQEIVDEFRRILSDQQSIEDDVLPSRVFSSSQSSPALEDRLAATRVADHYVRAILSGPRARGREEKGRECLAEDHVIDLKGISLQAFNLHRAARSPLFEKAYGNPRHSNALVLVSRSMNLPHPTKLLVGIGRERSEWRIHDFRALNEHIANQFVSKFMNGTQGQEGSDPRSGKVSKAIETQGD